MHAAVLIAYPCFRLLPSFLNLKLRVWEEDLASATAFPDIFETCLQARSSILSSVNFLARLSVTSLFTAFARRTLQTRVGIGGIRHRAYYQNRMVLLHPSHQEARW